MGCIKSLLRTWGNVLGSAILVCLLFPVNSWAAFASQFSFGFGEQYNDNIFFSRQKEHDFVSTFLPSLSFFYAPSGQIEPTGNLTITPIGEIYARHEELSGFGKNLSVKGFYNYRFSPKLRVDFSDTFRRQGATRTGGLDEAFQLQTGPTTPSSGLTSSQRLKDFVSRGDQLTNSFEANGAYLYKPDVSFAAFYRNSVAQFLDEGGTEVFHEVGGRGIYNWRRDHNLHAGYSISINKSRNGKDDGIIHNFDFGDDYFSNYTLQLTPTLSLAASSGLSFNAGNGGPKIANNTNITITKLWETAVLNAGFRKGLTPSFGISGISDTTSIFTNFIFRFSERLSTNADANFSFFDTKDVNFKTFQAGAGLQYAIASWLTSALNYRFRWIDSGSGASQTDLLSKGIVKSNAVFLVLTSHFDLWPNTGLARSLNSTALTPILKPPFSVPSANNPPNTP